jgi:SAM-dependent methyltransferase
MNQGVNSMSAEVGLSLNAINKRTFSERDVIGHYEGANGYMDAGERVVFDRVRTEMPAGPVLDMGVGAGRTIPLLRNFGCDYTGVDYIPSYIDRAHARHPGVDLRVMDARKLGFGSDHFALVVFSFNGIDSVGYADRIQIVREVHRVLKPGGVFVFSSLNLDGPSARERFLVPLEWHQGPTRLVRDLIRLPRYIFLSLAKGISTRIRGRGERRRVAEGFKLKQPPVHNYGLLLMFASVPTQVRQLEEAGFDVEAVYGERGTVLNGSRPDPTSRWCYFLARKRADRSA